MAKFREENVDLIYYINFFGLHLRIPEPFLPWKWLNFIIIPWTKFPMTILPVYILCDVRALVYDDMGILMKFGLIRKVFVFSGFLLKNIIFYWNQKKIERLIDLWDDSFQESFYPEEELIHRQRNLKRNKTIVIAVLLQGVAAAFSYSLPTFIKKKFTHPTGIVVSSRFPEFELAAIFDGLSALSAVSAAAYDCILFIFLSHVRAKLEFLQERLVYIINEIVIDDEGRLLGRKTIQYKSEEVYDEIDANGEEFLKNTENIDSKMKIWIHHHQQTISFFEELTKVYSSTATFQLGTIVIYTSLTALNMVKMKLNLEALGIGLVASCNLTSLFLWCKMAGDLRGIDVFGMAFGRAWFLLPKKVKTAFSFIIMRSKKPLTLYGFSMYAISLATFFEILKLTYQFFAFMVQVTTN